METSTFMRIRHRFCLFALIGLIGCGGQDSKLLLVPDIPGEIQGFSDFKALGSGRTSQAALGLVTVPQKGQVLVQVISEREQQLDSLFFDLEYNPSLFTPVTAQATEAIAPLADSLCLEILNVPGLVSCGQVPLSKTTTLVAAGTVLAEVLFAKQPFGRETASAEAKVPQSNNALSPLVWDEESGELHWYMVNPGDYDQNGMVGISDLTPLVIYFGMAGPFSFFGHPSVVDGHNDGEINISDITPIVLNWNNYIEGFNVYGSSNLADVPTSFNEPSVISPIATYLLSDAQGTVNSDRIWFSYTPEEGSDDLYYWVRPFAGDSEGTRSNLMSPTMDSSPPLGDPNGGFNLAPIALLSLVYTGTTVPLDVTFDASGSSDPDGEISLYEWDFEGDGLFDSFSTQPIVQHTFLNVGSYAPLVRVSDNGGLWDTIQSPEFLVQEGAISNIAPIADIFATSTSGELPFTVGFIATGSIDLDGYIANYEWDFDTDGVWDLDSGNDPTVLHTYTLSGLNATTLRVTDNQGSTATASIIVTALADNQAPVARLTSDVASGNAPLTINFNASGSYDYDGEIVEYAWDWDGNGIYDGTSGSAWVSHTYLDEGTFWAMVRVEDDNGSWDIETLEITVGAAVNLPPVADLQAAVTEGWTPLIVDFDASGSFDPDGTIVEYAWDWDGNGIYDGITYTPVASYTFTSAGSPDVRVRVQDNEGAGTVAKITIAVNVAGNAPPTASLFANPAVGDYPMLVTLDASASNDPDGSIDSYEWDFDGDGNYDLYGTNSSEDYTYLNEGTFLPKVRVTDNVGAQDTSTTLVQVHIEDWTMFGHDLQHTRRSWFIGPQTGAEKWSLMTGNTVWSSPAIGADSTIYIGSNDNELYALYPDGNLKWTYDTGDSVVSPPAVGVDQTIYVGSRSDRLYAINPDGTLKWSFLTGGSISAAPTVGTDGTIYIGSADTLFYAINPDGSKKWSYTTDGAVRSSAAISPGGIIYVGNDAGNIYALNGDGALAWVYATAGGVSSSPAIANDGTIYVGSNDSDLHAINPDGTGYWTYSTLNSINSSPAIALDGTIYIGSFDNNLHAVNPDGTVKWLYATGGIVRSSPTIGGDGTIYVGSYDNSLHAIHPDGSAFWTFTTNGNVLSSPAIGLDGTLYFASTDKRVYAIMGP